MSNENTKCTAQPASERSCPDPAGSTLFDPSVVIHKNEPDQMKPNGTQEDMKKIFGELPTVSELREAIAPKYRRMRW